MDDRRDDAPFPPPHDPEPDGSGQDPAPPPPPEVGGLPPWEDRARHGVIGGFFTTVAQVMTAPQRFFTNHPVDRGWLGPVSFAVVMGVIASAAGWAWSQVFTDMQTGMASMFGDLDPEAAADPALIATIQNAALVLSPFFALISLFIYAGLFHLGIMLVGSGGRGFEATLRAVSYAHAAYALSLVPMCGGVMTSIWLLVLYVVALAKLHRCGGGRAALIVLAPVLLMFCGCFGLFGVLGMLGS